MLNFNFFFFCRMYQCTFTLKKFFLLIWPHHRHMAPERVVNAFPHLLNLVILLQRPNTAGRTWLSFLIEYKIFVLSIILSGYLIQLVEIYWTEINCFITYITNKQYCIYLYCLYFKLDMSQLILMIHYVYKYIINFRFIYFKLPT